MSRFTKNMEVAAKLVVAFGNKKNIRGVDACLTRLRVTVTSIHEVNKESLKQLGAMRIIIIGNEIQAVFGKNSDILRTNMEEWLSNYSDPNIIEDLISAFGGKENITKIDACITRLRITVANKNIVKLDNLKKLGAMRVIEIANNIQAVFGKKSDALRKQLVEYIEDTSGN